MSFKEKIDKTNIPSHIAVIMDGNGRWAKKTGEMRSFGHQNGIRSVRETVEACVEMGVQYLTLYAFSTENWNRPPEEVAALMQILINSITNEKSTFHENGIRLNSIGDIAMLPQECGATLRKTMEETAQYNNMTLTLALSYSGKWDIVNAVKSIASDVKNGTIKIDDIGEELFASHLSTENMPDPELMIRTSGEMRISNFLLWQLAYAEIYITETLWPDFCKEDFYKALVEYQKRERRFGKTGDQINSTTTG